MQTRKLVIHAGRTESQYWQNLWRYQELFYFLAWRDILVRYKQTAIGNINLISKVYFPRLIIPIIRIEQLGKKYITSHQREKPAGFYRYKTRRKVVN